MTRQRVVKPKRPRPAKSTPATKADQERNARRQQAQAWGACKTKRVSLKRLTNAPYNPRVKLRKGDPEYERLKRSIEEFGIVEPIVWNKQTGHVVGGHQRLAILRAERVTSTDVVEIDVSLAREKVLNVALNKITGRWKEDALAELMRELRDDDGIDELLTGFDDDEIAKMLDQVEEPEADPEPEKHLSRQRVLESSYQVLAICADEEEQAACHELLTEAGYKTRVLTMAVDAAQAK